MHSGRTLRLGPAFESRPNALNAIRLALAATVILWHAYALAGHDYLPKPATRLLADLPVDAFFAISGFLICRAWERNPRLRSFAMARARRILPGLWLCLLITAFVIAPLFAQVAAGDQWRYVLGNATTWHAVTGIGPWPTGGASHVGEWNGSLWTLGYEAGCYVGVAALGAVGALRPRVLVAGAVAFWSMSVGMVMAGIPPVFGIGCIPRLGLMFTAGALLWTFREHIPIRRDLAILAMLAVVVGSFLPDYRIVGGPAVAYLMLWAALVLGRHPRLVLTNDLSYGTYVYGFPIQQALLLSGVTTAWLPFAVVSLAATLPIAAGSWFIVEQPALRRRRQVTRPQTPVRAAGVPLAMPAE